MRLAHRLRRSVYSWRYKFVLTEELIARVRASGGDSARRSLIEILKERLAHQDGSLAGVDWSGLGLSQVTLSASNMPRARFKGAKLKGAYFGYCDLRAASFQGADLREAHFRQADLSAAAFDGAELSGANFARARLNGCSFRAADLTGANFWGADLRGADFTDASLANCCLTAALIDEATNLPASRQKETAGSATRPESNREW